jgi:hypothetical protein
VNRLLNIVLVVLLLALVPLRGLAAAAHGHCGDASPEYAQAQDDASQSSTHDDGGGEHCAGMSAIPSVSLSLPGDRSEERSRHGERFVIGFIPEHLDPPPLAR